MDAQLNDGSETARLLRKALGQCAICGSFNWADHRYCEVATIVSEPSSNEQLFALAKEGRWRELIARSRGDASKDLLIWYGIRCETGRIELVYWFSPFELYAANRLLDREALTDESQAHLERELVGGGWVPMDSL